MKKIMSLLLVTLLIFTACTGTKTNVDNDGNKDANQNQANQSQTNQSQTKKIKDTLYVSQGAEPTTLDPHSGKDTASVSIHKNIFNTLVTFNEDMELVGQVAESWEVLSETSTKFNIRKDMVFHNGMPLTADDVVFSLERAMATATIAHLVGFIDNVEKVDDYTVIVNSKEPFAATFANLSSPPVAIVCKAVVEELGDKAFESPIGTGPYKFVEWKHNEYVKLEAYDKYFLGESKTKNIVIRTIPETSQRTIGLETGELDISYNIAPNDAKRISENSDLTLMETPSLAVTYLMLNMKKEIMDDIYLRQAIRHAIDLQSIVDVIINGAGVVAPNMIAPAVFGYNDDLDIYEYDTEKAKELLAKSKHPNGCEIEVYTADSQVRIEVLQVLENQLEQIGVKLNISILEYGVFYEKIANGEHDMAIFGFTTPTGDAEYPFGSLFHTKSFGAAGNRAFYSNEKVDNLIDEAKKNTNQDERLKTYKEIQEIVYEECPYIPLFVQNSIVGISNKVEGFRPHPSEYHYLYNVVCYE